MVQRRIPEKVKKEVEEYIEALKAENLPIQAAYLFGSYAKGKSHKWSDIDLCIVSPNFKNPWEALQYLWSKRLRDSGLTIEPIGYNPKDFKEDDSPLVWEIKQTGIPIAT